MSIAWQLIPYCVLTISEILVSTTGLNSPIRKPRRI